jgi:hypothetical protein
MSKTISIKLSTELHTAVAERAKAKNISVEDATVNLVSTGISRLNALNKHSAKHRKEAKKAAKAEKAAKPAKAAAKPAAKAAPKAATKPAAKPVPKGLTAKVAPKAPAAKPAAKPAATAGTTEQKSRIDAIRAAAVRAKTTANGAHKPEATSSAQVAQA